MTMKRLCCAIVLLCACKRSAHVAEMTKHHGEVQRDTAATKDKWESAPDGSKLSIGDGLHTGTQAEAVVHLTNGGNIAIKSDTTIRFLNSAPGAANPKLAVEAGEASIEAGDAALAMETSIGTAKIEPGGKLRVTSSNDGTRVEVTVGAAHLDGVDLSVGKAYDVSLGGAIVERAALADAGVDAGKKTDVAAAEEDAGPADQATLVVHGAGVRTQVKGATTWKPAAEGIVPIGAGDTIDVPNGASVDIQRGGNRARLVGTGKYVVGDVGGSLVRANAGRVELDSDGEVTVDVPGGSLALKAGSGKSRATAEVRANDTKVNVAQGQGEVRAGTTTETVRAGESATITAKGQLVVASRGPEKIDFTVRAGDSLIIRDPRPPSALGFDVTSVCPGTAVIQRGDQTVRGEKRVGMFLPAGHHEYAIRCVGPDGLSEKPVATGAVTVIGDAARAELARLPPSTVVDMDGRRYTVLYQNLLPSVIARWQDAPAGGKGYTLHVDKDRFKSADPRQSLKAGSIPEGTHTMFFESDDGKKSAETTLVIKFDNAAPAASVREPLDGTFAAGESVKVAGVVVEGWTVQVNGTPVSLDAQKRFSTTASVPPGENAIVLRLSHPQRGTVYYVRHAK